MQDEKLEIENEKEPNVNKKKKRNDYFCVAYSYYFPTSIYGMLWRIGVALLIPEIDGSIFFECFGYWYIIMIFIK